MSDEPKNKKWDMVAQVPVRRVPKRNMQLRQEIATGELEGRRFEIAMGMDGGLWVGFERAPGEPEGELSADRFVLRPDDLMEAIARVVMGDPEAEVDAKVKGGLALDLRTLGISVRTHEPGDELQITVKGVRQARRVHARRGAEDCRGAT